MPCKLVETELLWFRRLEQVPGFSLSLEEEQTWAVERSDEHHAMPWSTARDRPYRPHPGGGHDEAFWATQQHSTTCGEATSGKVPVLDFIWIPFHQKTLHQDSRVLGCISRWDFCQNFIEGADTLSRDMQRGLSGSLQVLKVVCSCHMEGQLQNQEPPSHKTL